MYKNSHLPLCGRLGTGWKWVEWHYVVLLKAMNFYKRRENQSTQKWALHPQIAWVKKTTRTLVLIIVGVNAPLSFVHIEQRRRWKWIGLKRNWPQAAFYISATATYQTKAGFRHQMLFHSKAKRCLRERYYPIHLRTHDISVNRPSLIVFLDFCVSIHK